MQINPQEYDEVSRYESLIGSYPGQPQYILAIMQDLQKQYNYLPRLAISMISGHVRVPVSKVYAIASFYKAFSLTPKGRYVFRVCDGTACHIKNSETLLDQLHQHLGIRAGQTSEDGQFSIETVNCLGACALAPVVVVNGKVYGKVKPGDLEEIIRECGGQCHVRENEGN
ncbi:MAG: NAD(P)H-dependent oxidoreductase subunit E [Syntrophomonadaceae bacterium]|jgi:NADH-quinone oxidoreductase subunit E|nr:NAD(P)H-dependent oxidoreductase subunit E [Syntrophomonadaceae bacterium]